jgi:hypothetical protein
MLMMDVYWLMIGDWWPFIFNDCCVGWIFPLENNSKIRFYFLECVPPIWKIMKKKIFLTISRRRTGVRVQNVQALLTSSWGILQYSSIFNLRWGPNYHSHPAIAFVLIVISHQIIPISEFFVNISDPVHIPPYNKII